MKRFRVPLLAIGTFSFCNLVYAAAFQLYELGTPIIGTAAVGQAALASDASTAYFNPAGMADLTTSQGMLGSQLAIQSTSFSANRATTITGNNGGNAGTLIPGIDAYYVYHYSPQLKIGMSLTTPYGGILDYNNHWVGRYNVQQMEFYTFNFNPAMAYRVNPWLALGGGVSLEYANFYQTIATPISATLDGQATLKMNNTAPGFNLGAYITPFNTTKIGIAFRSQIVHNLNGTADFLNLNITPATASRMIMPSNVIASLSQHIGNRFTLLGELGWADWSSMKNSVIYIAGFTADVPQNWHNTYRVGLGGQYQCLSSLLLQAGVSYDSSPTSNSHRLPELPMDRQIRVGAGLEYNVLKAVSLGLSYEYINLGSASINNISSSGVLAGSYSKNYTNILQLSVNVSA